MNITIQTEITERRTCGPCIEDEHAAPGLHCSCYEEDVQVVVVADVSIDEAKSDRPFGLLGPAARIDILSIKDRSSGSAWSPMEIGLLEDEDKLRIEDALWNAYLHASKTRPAKVLSVGVSS